MSGSHGATPQRRWHERPDYPWLRLFVALMLGTVGGAGMYMVVVVLPEVQATSPGRRGRAGRELPVLTSRRLVVARRAGRVANRQDLGRNARCHAARSATPAR